MLEYSRNLKEPSRELRKEMTEAEQKLWGHLRRKQILDIQFYRQKPLGPYIVDFYAPAAKLVVEVDGSQHHEPEYLKKMLSGTCTLPTMACWYFVMTTGRCCRKQVL